MPRGRTCRVIAVIRTPAAGDDSVSAQDEVKALLARGVDWALEAKGR